MKEKIVSILNINGGRIMTIRSVILLTFVERFLGYPS